MRHLKDNNMNYWTHLSFALKLFAQLIVMAIISVIHAIIQFFFQNSISSGIKAMDAKLQEIAN